MALPTADDLRKLGLTLMTVPGMVVHGIVISNNAEKIAAYIAEHPVRPVLYRAGTELIGEVRSPVALAEHLLTIAGEVSGDDRSDA